MENCTDLTLKEQKTVFVKVNIFDVDYIVEDGNAVIRVYGKAGQDTFKGRFEDFQPYLYVVPREKEAFLEDLEENKFTKKQKKIPVIDVEKKEMIDLNERMEVFKIKTSEPPMIPELRKQLSDLETVKECREFDIAFYKRFLIDNNISPTKMLELEGETIEEDDFDKVMKVEKISGSKGENSDYSTVAFDLETYEGEIIMISFYTENWKKLYTTVDIDREFSEKLESEKQLVEKFIAEVNQRDWDVLTGYNTDEFDFKKLRERAQHHGLDLNIGRNGERMKFKRRGRFSAARVKGRMHLDLYPFVSHVLSPGLESDTLDLDSVASEILGVGKDELDFKDMKRIWDEKSDLERFADYAMKDSRLAYRLGERIIPQIFELSKITGLIPFDACRLTYGQLTENFLLQESNERNMLAPNRPTRGERDNRRRQGAYEGGFVYEPDAGLYEDIAVMDFKSLYPTVMVSHNISPDTYELENCEDVYILEEYGYKFCQDQQGFFPELIEGLVEERSSIKEKMNKKKNEENLKSRSSALKILANSFYGYLGYDGARWYSKECAEATTFLGREYIQDTIERAEKRGFKVVYGDTDSLFLKLNGEQEMDKFLEEVNKELPSFMELELEGIFKRAFFTSTSEGRGAKKKYAMIDEDGNLKITGFEQVRRDWSPIAKKTQKKVLRKVLEDDVEEALQTVKDTVERLKNGDVPVEELKIHTKLTKDPEEYDSKAPHVEAVKKAKEKGDKIEAETTVDYVITRGAGSISDRAELTKYAEDYDADYYIDKQIIPVSFRVLKVFGYEKTQLKGEGKQSGLGRFSN